MNFVEIISFAKVYSVALGLDDKRVLSKMDLDIASEFLKKSADEFPYWNQSQRDVYKFLTDFIKETLKEQIDG